MRLLKTVTRICKPYTQKLSCKTKTSASQSQRSPNTKFSRQSTADEHNIQGARGKAAAATNQWWTATVNGKPSPCTTKPRKSSWGAENNKLKNREAVALPGIHDPSNHDYIYRSSPETVGNCIYQAH